MNDPVVPLKVNLYGHPAAGLLWEAFRNKAIIDSGFEPVRGWESTFYHKKLQMFLVVYVDDFHMAGKTCNMKKAWALLRSRKLEEPRPFDGATYLGNTQHDDNTMNKAPSPTYRDFCHNSATRKTTVM